MARQARIVIPGAPHHVYLRGNNRRRLFSSDRDRLFWIACMRRALDLTACLLHQQTLMTNHVHNIITPPSKEALSECIKRACQRYAQMRNDARGATGKLFEERYRSKVIKDERQMMMTTLYNDANAFRANDAASPLEHEWSTGPLHAGLDGADRLRSLWTPSRWYMGLARTPAERAETYRALMAAYTRDESPAPIDPEIVAFERADDGTHELRIERPDRSSAREPMSRYGQIPSKRR